MLYREPRWYWRHGPPLAAWFLTLIIAGWLMVTAVYQAVMWMAGL